MASTLVYSTKLLYNKYFYKHQQLFLQVYFKTLSRNHIADPIHSIRFFITVLASKLVILFHLLEARVRINSWTLMPSPQTLCFSAALCPLSSCICSVPATWLLTEKEQILEHHFPRWSISISISKWGNCWCRKSLNKKASPSNALMKRRIPWQWNEDASNHIKRATTQRKCAHSKVLHQFHILTSY